MSNVNVVYAAWVWYVTAVKRKLKFKKQKSRAMRNVLVTLTMMTFMSTRRSQPTAFARGNIRVPILQAKLSLRQGRRAGTGFYDFTLDCFKDNSRRRLR